MPQSSVKARSVTQTPLTGSTNPSTATFCICVVTSSALCHQIHLESWATCSVEHLVDSYPSNGKKSGRTSTLHISLSVCSVRHMNTTYSRTPRTNGGKRAATTLLGLFQRQW